MALNESVKKERNRSSDDNLLQGWLTKEFHRKYKEELLFQYQQKLISNSDYKGRFCLLCYTVSPTKMKTRQYINTNSWNWNLHDNNLFCFSVQTLCYKPMIFLIIISYYSVSLHKTASCGLYST